MVLRQVGADFEIRYGFAPWLVESFIDTEHFLGTCYKAANWSAIGQSQGRGRQDREHQNAKSVKAIYIYAIEPGWEGNAVKNTQNPENTEQSAYFLSKFKIRQIFEFLSPTGC